MPIYVYEVVRPDGKPGELLEAAQAMSEPAWTRHPKTGQPVRRVIQAPHIGGKWSEAGTRAMLSDRNLAEKGFTKYVKTGEGRYEKTTGDGPAELGA